MGAPHDKRTDQYSEQIAAFVLGALEAGEARRLQSHLRHCASCRVELAIMRIVALALALALDLAATLPGHRRRFRAKLSSTLSAEQRRGGFRPDAA